METEYQSCISLTSEEDGRFRTECLSLPISEDILSFTKSKLYRTIPLDGDFEVSIKGAGFCVVMIHDGNIDTKPLYLMNLRHRSTVDIVLCLTENGRRVRSTFNDESFEIDVDGKNVKAEVLVMTGSITTDIAVNGDEARMQTVQMYDDEIERQVFEYVSRSSVSSIEDDEDKNGRYIKNDDDGDDYYNHENDDDEYNSYGESCVKRCDKSNYKEDESLSTGDDSSDVSGFEKVDDQNIDDFDKYMEQYDDDDDDNIESNVFVCESFEEIRYIDSEKAVDQMIDQHECKGVYTQMMFAKQEILRYDTVDIRTNRTELIKTMRSDKLADYFFEAELISEDNMSEIQHLWRNDNRAANGCFLDILRNKKVPKHKIKAVLEKAEELHLLDLMFPKQSHFVTASTQTDDFNFNNHAQEPEARFILNSLRLPMLNLMFNRLC